MPAGARAMHRAPLAVVGIMDAVWEDGERGGRSDGGGEGGAGNSRRSVEVDVHWGSGAAFWIVDAV